MRIALPDEVRQIPVAEPQRAIAEFAGVMAEIRGIGAAADLEAAATEAVESATREGAILMGVVLPADADPALLTGVLLATPPTWDDDIAETLRDALENIGGPDVRETVTIPTGLGPAVLAQRVPGVEQARARLPMTLQLQALIPDVTNGRMLLLTLAGPSPRGWATHQQLFGEIVGSAEGPEGVRQVQDVREPAVEEPVAQPRGRARRRPEPVVEEEDSFEFHTFQL